MTRRISAALDAIAARHPRQTVLLVMHALSLAALHCAAYGIPLAQVYRHLPPNASLQILEWT